MTHDEIAAEQMPAVSQDELSAALEAILIAGGSAAAWPAAAAKPGRAQGPDPPRRAP